MPLPGPLRQPWTLSALLAPAAALALSTLLIGCADEAGPSSEGATDDGSDTTLAAPEEGVGADPLGSASGADQGESAPSYDDVDGPFLLELGAVDGGLQLEVQLARILVHVDEDVVALAVTDAWIAVDEATSRWSAAWEGELPQGMIHRVELTLAGEARVHGEPWAIPGAWRDLFLDVPFESGADMPVVVLTGLIDTQVDGEELQPWLEQTVLRQVDASGEAEPYGAGASSR